MTSSPEALLILMRVAYQAYQDAKMHEAKAAEDAEHKRQEAIALLKQVLKELEETSDD